MHPTGHAANFYFVVAVCVHSALDGNISALVEYLNAGCIVSTCIAQNCGNNQGSGLGSDFFLSSQDFAANIALHAIGHAGSIFGSSVAGDHDFNVAQSFDFNCFLHIVTLVALFSSSVASFGAGSILALGDHEIVAASDNFLGNQNFVANGALHASGQTVGGAGSLNSGDDLLDMLESGTDYFVNHDLAAVLAPYLAVDARYAALGFNISFEYQLVSAGPAEVVLSLVSNIVLSVLHAAVEAVEGRSDSQQIDFAASIAELVDRHIVGSYNYIAPVMAVCLNNVLSILVVAQSALYRSQTSGGAGGSLDLFNDFKSMVIGSAVDDCLDFGVAQSASSYLQTISNAGCFFNNSPNDFVVLVEFVLVLLLSFVLLVANFIFVGLNGFAELAVTSGTCSVEAISSFICPLGPYVLELSGGVVNLALSIAAFTLALFSPGCGYEAGSVGYFDSHVMAQLSNFLSFESNAALFALLLDGTSFSAVGFFDNFAINCYMSFTVENNSVASGTGAVLALFENDTIGLGSAISFCKYTQGYVLVVVLVVCIDSVLDGVITVLASVYTVALGGAGGGNYFNALENVANRLQFSGSFGNNLAADNANFGYMAVFFTGGKYNFYQVEEMCAGSVCNLSLGLNAANGAGLEGEGAFAAVGLLGFFAPGVSLSICIADEVLKFNAVFVNFLCTANNAFPIELSAALAANGLVVVLGYDAELMLTGSLNVSQYRLASLFINVFGAADSAEYLGLASNAAGGRNNYFVLGTGFDIKDVAEFGFFGYFVVAQCAVPANDAFFGAGGFASQYFVLQVGLVCMECSCILSNSAGGCHIAANLAGLGGDAISLAGHVNGNFLSIIVLSFLNGGMIILDGSVSDDAANIADHVVLFGSQAGALYEYILNFGMNLAAGLAIILLGGANGASVFNAQVYFAVFNDHAGIPLVVQSGSNFGNLGPILSNAANGAEFTLVSGGGAIGSGNNFVELMLAYGCYRAIELEIAVFAGYPCIAPVSAVGGDGVVVDVSMFVSNIQEQGIAYQSAEFANCFCLTVGFLTKLADGLNDDLAFFAEAMVLFGSQIFFVGYLHIVFFANRALGPEVAICDAGSIFNFPTSVIAILASFNEFIVVVAKGCELYHAVSILALQIDGSIAISFCAVDVSKADIGAGGFLNYVVVFGINCGNGVHFRVGAMIEILNAICVYPVGVQAAFVLASIEIANDAGAGFLHGRTYILVIMLQTRGSGGNFGSNGFAALAPHVGQYVACAVAPLIFLNFDFVVAELINIFLLGASLAQGALEGLDALIGAGGFEGNFAFVPYVYQTSVFVSSFVTANLALVIGEAFGGAIAENNNDGFEVMLDGQHFSRNGEEAANGALLASGVAGNEVTILLAFRSNSGNDNRLVLGAGVASQGAICALLDAGAIFLNFPNPIGFMGSSGNAFVAEITVYNMVAGGLGISPIEVVDMTNSFYAITTVAGYRSGKTIALSVGMISNGRFKVTTTVHAITLICMLVSIELYKFIREVATLAMQSIGALFISSKGNSEAAQYHAQNQNQSKKLFHSLFQSFLTFRVLYNRKENFPGTCYLGLR